MRNHGKNSITATTAATTTTATTTGIASAGATTTTAAATTASATLAFHTEPSNHHSVPLQGLLPLPQGLPPPPPYSPNPPSETAAAAPATAIATTITTATTDQPPLSAHESIHAQLYSGGSGGGSGHDDEPMPDICEHSYHSEEEEEDDDQRDSQDVEMAEGEETSAAVDEPMQEASSHHPPIPPPSHPIPFHIYHQPQGPENASAAAGPQPPPPPPPPSSPLPPSQPIAPYHIPTFEHPPIEPSLSLFETYTDEILDLGHWAAPGPSDAVGLTQQPHHHGPSTTLQSPLPFPHPLGGAAALAVQTDHDMQQQQQQQQATNDTAPAVFGPEEEAGEAAGGQGQEGAEGEGGVEDGDWDGVAQGNGDSDDNDAADMMHPEPAVSIVSPMGTALPNPVALVPPTLPAFVPPLSNAIVLLPGNPGLEVFLRIWAMHGIHGERYGRRATLATPRGPTTSQVALMASKKLRQVLYEDLNGDRCDMQGIDWEMLSVTRKNARDRRLQQYSNYTNMTGTDRPERGPLPYIPLPRTDGYYRFRKMLIRQDVVLSHFQLRSVLACPSRSHAYYPGTKGVHRLNLVTGRSDLAMDFHDLPTIQITTLDARHGMLVAGTFSGEYYLKRLDADEGAGAGAGQGFCEGQITTALSGITNHLQIYLSRSGSPSVAFSSNDRFLRNMDLEARRFTMRSIFRMPLNCSALSPDRRLRVVVGDSTAVFITNADTGEIMQKLDGHRDFGFACDWSEDGFTVATGFQDKTVKVWDSRRWCDSSGTAIPIRTIRSEMAGVRSVRFSPLGCGARVLVTAEEADYVNVIDAQTLTTKQTFDIFGEIAGVEFANEGRDINVLCADRTRGGVLQLEQCGMGMEWFRQLNMAGMPDYLDPWRAMAGPFPHYRGPAQYSRLRTDLHDDMAPF